MKKPCTATMMAKMTVVVLGVALTSVWSQTCITNCLCCNGQVCDFYKQCTRGCIEGYYGTYCTQKCPDNCKTCAQITFDSIRCSCVDGYAGAQCNEECSPNCKSCNQYNSDSCIYCIDGYYMGYFQDMSQYPYDYSCTHACHHTCATCQSYSRCIFCASGRFKTDSGLCEGQCSSGCKTCTSSTQCNICISGYVWDNNKCLKCPINCSTCLTDGSCQTCNDGYFVDNNKTCSPCVSHCKMCMDGNKCHICEDGYEIEGNTCAVKCSDGCKTCLVPTECSICNDGYILENGVCNEVICTGNTYLDISECKTCPLNCTSCISMEECTECVNGSKGTTCNETCDNCKPLSHCDQESGYCSGGCADGLYGKQCNKTCDSNCETCQRYTGNCIRCANGYHDYLCRCPPECNSCHQSGACYTCKTDFYVTSLDCKCRKDVCEGSICSSCKNDSYYKRGDYCCHCNAKIDNCQECGDVHNVFACNKCDHGFYPLMVSTSVCEQCPEKCIEKDCDSATGRCTKGCGDGFWGDRCDLKCMDHCVRCQQDTGHCLECNVGKYNENCSENCSVNCRKSPDGHTLCQMDGTCVLGCSAGFFGSTCIQECNATCSIVDGNRCYDTNGECISGCADGYYGKFCEKQCNENCVNRTCDSQTGACVCKDGYTGALCSKAKIVTEGNESGTTSAVLLGGAIGGAIGFLAILTIFIIFSVIVCRKRRKDNDSGVYVNRNSYTEQDGGVRVYYNVRDVEVKDENMGAEYEEIPDGALLSKNDLDAGRTPREISPKTKKETSTQIRTSNGFVKDAGQDSCDSSLKSMIKDNDKDKEAEKEVADETLKVERLTNEPKESLLEAENMPSAGIDWSGEVDDTYYNEGIIKNNRILVDDLVTYVSEKTTEEFIKEFLNLPQGLVKPYQVSQQAENISKNRYKGVYPYDATRVVLEGGDSDYINASYIDGYKNRKTYIASMGPTFKFMKDMTSFWRMIWQNKVDKIVMLTNLQEGDVPKCDMYWPYLHMMDTHGDISVTFENENISAEYDIRSFKVEKGSESRTVIQYHFTAWPDKQTPENVISLVSFWHTVNSGPIIYGGPILVHCSAGVGRTGTYIALDALSREGTSENSVDVFSFVVNLRYQRVNMVQTWEQYVFLHQALVYTLTFKTKPMDVNNFTNYMSSHSDSAETFQNLTKCKCINSDVEEAAKAKNKTLTDKNRSDADIPGNTNRLLLHVGRKLGSSDYINAVYVNSFKVKNHFIVAQTPLPSTIEEFLLLINQEQCSCIIDCDNQDIGKYLPNPAIDQTRKFGAFTINVEKSEDHNTHTQKSLILSYMSKTTSEDINVTWLKLKGWKDNANCPGSVIDYLNFVEHVSGIVKNNPKKPILIHCRNGASRSGLFCVVLTILEKIACDQEVSIINIICQMRSRRSMAIPNKEQYIFCHKIVEEYLKTDNIYSNVC